MNNVKEYFEKNNIQYVLFDMDSTLVDTSTYYTKEMFCVISTIVKMFLPNTLYNQNTEITQEIRNISRDIHKANGIPLLVYDLTYQGVMKYLEIYNIKNIKREKIRNKIKELFADFYNNSPMLFPETLSVLYNINMIHIPMYVYSHAQRDWTEIKVNRIRTEYEKMYSENLSLPFFTTDITQTKDCNGWKKVADIFNLDIKNTLVVGDSLTSDILPAIQAGYVNLIYLSTKEDDIDKPKDINLKVVGGIGDILNL